MEAVKVDFTGEGYAGSWVEFKDPRYLPRKKFEEAAARLREATNNNDAAGGDEFLRSRISAWHITYTDEDGVAVSLSDPKLDDLGFLPVPLYVSVWKHISELFRVEIPNG